MKPGIALLVAVLCTAGCDVKVGDGGFSVDIARGKASNEWVRTYSLPPGASLEVINVNGMIEATPAAGRDVEVRAIREAKAPSDEEAKALLDKIEIVENVEQSGGTVSRVKIEARGEGSRGIAGMPRRSSLSIRYAVRVPTGLNVSFKTENGGIRMDGIGGTLAASTTNGGITARNVSGALNVSTVNGGLQIALASVTGDVQLGAVNGGIRLELPSDIDAQVEAGTVNGGVSIDDALPIVTTEKDRRRVSGKLNKGGPRISAQTTNGGVRITAAGARPPSS